MTALRITLALLTAAAVTVPAGSAFASSSQPQHAAPTTQGIIMRDGGICDPIRHMGC